MNRGYQYSRHHRRSTLDESQQSRGYPRQQACGTEGVVTMSVPQRRCFALDLKDDPEVIARYKHWHRPGGPPAEITQTLRAAGIIALDIYLIGNRLFMIMESDDSASGATRTDDTDHPQVRAWEALMSEMQQDLPFPRGASETGKWRLLEHIYSLAAQP